MEKFRMYQNCILFSYGKLFNENGFPASLMPIVDLFAEDCGRDLQNVYVDGDRLFIDGVSKSEECNECMLRFSPTTMTITVARVEFVHKRVGNMTKLQGLLYSLAKDDGYVKIVIEAVLSESMHNFCVKNNYLPRQHTAGDFEKSIV